MVADTDAPDISDVVAELAVVEPTAFTETRNAKAKELRSAKERDRAALVAKLAKPSWTAWSLNVLARQDPDAIASWLAAGEALEAALGGGDREALRDAQRDERSSLASTIDQASAILAAAGRKVDDQVAPKLTGTLRAAITDPDVRDRLTRGVLVDDVEAAAVGFGFGFGFGADDAGGGAEVVGLDELRARRAAKKAAKKAPKKAATAKAFTAKATSPTRPTTPTDDEVDAEAEAAAEEAQRAEEAAMAARAQALAKAEAKRVAAERARLERELRALERQRATRSADAEASEVAAIAAREAADAAAAALRSTEDALAETRRALDALAPPP